MKPIDISEQLMLSTVRLVDNNGNCGTGYFFSFDSSRGKVPVIITNKHVINNNPNEPMIFDVHLSSDGESDEGIYSLKYATQWIFHSEKDLCFTYVAGLFNSIEKITGKKVFFKAFESQHIYSEEKLKQLSMMESVVMVGYPIGLYDRKHNYPIFRYGYTASHPGYDFNEEGIGLVDIACFPGSSGSPVIVLNQGIYKDKAGGIVAGADRVILLGTLFAGPTYNVDGKITIRDIPTAQTAMTESRIMINLGFYIKAAALNEFATIIAR